MFYFAYNYGLPYSCAWMFYFLQYLCNICILSNFTELQIEIRHRFLVAAMPRLHVNWNIWKSKCFASVLFGLLYTSPRVQHLQLSCASISLHGWGDTQWPIDPPLIMTIVIHLNSLPPERCKVSQQVWNRVMNWTWTCVLPYCDLLD